jgi:pilus assembly protein Flp/PilA
VKKLVQTARALRKRDDGASAVEYGLLVALIAVVIAGTVFALGGGLNAQFDKSQKCVTTPTDANC